MSETDTKIHELVAKIERGEIRLPEMQRRYVWQKTRVRDLLDSLYRGYPSGAILTWETNQDIPTRDFSIAQKTDHGASFQLLLDGQQRLTSLSAILSGKPVRVRGLKKPIDIMFNLEHPENLELVTEVDDDSTDTDADHDGSEYANESDMLKNFKKMTFMVHNKLVASQPHWVSVTDILKDAYNEAQIMEDAGVHDMKDPRYKKYSERIRRLRNIRDYSYRVHTLDRSMPYAEVAEIFVRVNSLGAKLRSSDLALAQITAKWRGSSEIFQSYDERWKSKGFDLDLSIYLKNLTAFATNSSSFKAIGRIPKEDLMNSWEQAKKGMDFSLNFLRNNVKIESPALLASPFLAITIAKYAHKKEFRLSNDEESQLRYWTLVANAKGRYSRGSSETLLNEDLSIVNRDENALDRLINTLRTQVGRLDIQASDIESRNSRSAYFKTMFIAFMTGGAKDWMDQVAISDNTSGAKHSLQFHHIFPKSILEKAGMAKEKLNDICNLAFIGGNTNQVIGSKSPSVYLQEIIEKGGEEALRKQCVPTDPQLWEIEAYEDFLRERRKLVVKRLNDFLGHKWGSRENSE